MTVRTSTAISQAPEATHKTIDKIDENQFLTAEEAEIERLEEEAKKIEFETVVVWRNVLLFASLHFGAVIGAWQLVSLQAMWQTMLWTFFLHVIGGFGITAGAHRLWAHRSYKARLPVRIFLMFANCIALQNDIIEWCRDHRCHHKWTDTNADPHNTKRGFFFAHMGWLLVRKHPQVKDQGAKLDLSDLYADPVCMWQRHNYVPLVLLFCFLLPAFVPVYVWGESAFIAFYTASLFRYCFTLHATWCVNSVAHWVGFKPYDVTITPVQSLGTSLVAVGEGFHNYHHVFPQDYRTSESSWKLNWTKGFIDCCAALGLVYDRKEVADEVISRHAAAHGDGHYAPKMMKTH